MTKVEAIIRPSQFDKVQEALAHIGVDGITVSEVRGHERQRATLKPIAGENIRSISF